MSGLKGVHRSAGADRLFSCHLCLSDASGPSMGYFGSELCERCYHLMTSAQAKDRFTDGLVQLHTGAVHYSFQCMHPA